MSLSAVYSCGRWVNDWISRRADITGGWVALKDNLEKPLRVATFSQLDRDAGRIAGLLREEWGVGKGDVVAILSWSRIEFVEVLLACFKLGCVLAPINTRYSKREVSEFVEQTKPKVVLYERELEQGVEGISVDKACYDCASEFSFSSRQPLEASAECCLEDPAMLLQTGGTTGKPKFAVVSHRMILWNALNTVRDLIIPGDVTINTLPLFHIGAYTYLIPLLIFGGTSILMHRWNVDEFIDLVEQERPSFLFLVPTQLRMLLQSPRFKDADFSSVRWITSGGGALTRDLIEKIFEKGVVQKQGFGMTEMGPGVFALDPWDAQRKMGSIGKPNLLVEAKIVNPEGAEVPAGAEGELLLRGPSVFAGYLRNEEEMRALVRDGWIATGDVARRDEEGYFWIVGRLKNIIRSGEESVYPEEIEKLLLMHPKIKDVVVIGVPDEKWGEVPKALIVLKEGERITKEEVVEFLRDKIAKYKIPKYVEVVKDLIYTETGKVSRSALKQMYGQPRDRLEV
ncbi:class I adenylate-forming enzyme family protein [Infirmifilum sp. NZ]|uniref:class I adenylate-forming enzyme family protein n=1 Tax=Infirmifilum sp. NZ TaxID=2926850 RepID=UPI00279F1F3D|nr:AMP-binding protein [Infirmifilum sp. NZ]UNQ73492.1 AMP-binding protein [Infirmifilum sp. NZ]